MNKENFTHHSVSNPSCRTITFPRAAASVPQLFFNSCVSVFYNLLEMLRYKR